jgi:hypothetical protein
MICNASHDLRVEGIRDRRRRWLYRALHRELVRVLVNSRDETCQTTLQHLANRLGVSVTEIRVALVTSTLDGRGD